MRIGDLAKKYHIPVNTLYYYIKIGLLVPNKKGKQYDFDQNCEKDLQLILQYSKWDFTLKDIHTILSLYRYSNLLHPDDVQAVSQLMSKKCQMLEQERQRLKEIIGQIEQAQADIVNSLQPPPKQKIGLPLGMLALLQCPFCKQELHMENTMMNPHYIFQGDLCCDCGYEATIQNGVLITPFLNTSPYDKPDLERKQYTQIPPDMVSLYQRSYNWMNKQMAAIKLEGKVVMESHINAYFFLQMYLHLLSPKGKYIIVDKFPEMLYMYKNLIDSQLSNLDVLYIADSSSNLPLREECVDVYVDFFAFNEHKFYATTALMDEYRRFFAPESEIVGTYFHFYDAPRSLALFRQEFPEAASDNFDMEIFRGELSRNGFKIISESEIGHTTFSGGQESAWGLSFHTGDEKMHLTSYHAKNQSVSAPPKEE